MRFLAPILVTAIAGCAGPGTITVGRTSEGIQFDFFHQRGPGIELPRVDVFEFEGGVRGRTVCSLRIKEPRRDHRVALARWVYGKPAERGEYLAEACETLSPNRTYGIAGFGEDRRVVWADFWIADDGSVFRLKSSRD